MELFWFVFHCLENKSKQIYKCNFILVKDLYFSFSWIKVFESLSFKTSTNFKKCLNHETTNFLDVYQDFRLGGFMFHRSIDCTCWKKWHCQTLQSLFIEKFSDPPKVGTKWGPLVWGVWFDETGKVTFIFIKNYFKANCFSGYLLISISIDSAEKTTVCCVIHFI